MAPVSERVARSFSSPSLRIHLGGDASYVPPSSPSSPLLISSSSLLTAPFHRHVHSVFGAFGLNSSIYDASNLSWKVGLCARNLASTTSLLPSYDLERRLFANRVIRASGAYMRFVSGSDLPLAQLRGEGDELETYLDNLPARDGTREGDIKWLGEFFAQQKMFVVGFEVPTPISTICPPMNENGKPRPITVENGRRAPNPRICFDEGMTGYLYDKMTGASRFHILIFGSDLQGTVRAQLARLSQHTLGPKGFFAKYGGRAMFNIVLVLKALTHEKEDLLKAEEMQNLRNFATVVYDDRSPDEDAHYWYGINRARGAVVAVRPDLWVGMSCWPEETSMLEEYFGGFLIKQGESSNGVHEST